MKPKIAVLLLAVLLCLTTGCNNASHIAETPDPISSSDSNIVPSESETAQAEKKTEVDRPQSTESQTDSRAAEFPASVSESDTQTTEVPDQADHSTAVLPQPSEPEKKTDESERRPETAAPTEKEQPTPPATEESTPPEPPKEEPTLLVSVSNAKIAPVFLLMKSKIGFFPWLSVSVIEIHHKEDSTSVRSEGATNLYLSFSTIRTLSFAFNWNIPLGVADSK